jgi:ferredoxin
MSDIVPHKRELRREGRLRRFIKEPQAIFYEGKSHPEIEFEDGSKGLATCLRCHDAPCIVISDSDSLLTGLLNEFPGDPSRDVCPTNAIDWGEYGEMPEIDDDKCIGCGLCVSSCPYGAIRLTELGKAEVLSDDPDGITENQKKATEPHLEIPRKGMIAIPSAPFARDMPEIVGALNERQNMLLARNMLMACGVVASIRRKGDTNIRMDALLQFSSGQIGVVELETGVGVLDSPRALLEDIAVLHNRIGVPLSNIEPISVILALPNGRSEYFQVVDDIAKVLGIRCRTLTLGTLCILMWHFGRLENLTDDLFTTATGATDLYPSLKRLLPKLPSDELYPGAYRPSK